jgi:hypothetical protein
VTLVALDRLHDVHRDIEILGKDEALGDEQVVRPDLLDLADLLAVAPVGAPACLDLVVGGAHA